MTLEGRLEEHPIPEPTPDLSGAVYIAPDAAVGAADPPGTGGVHS